MNTYSYQIDNNLYLNITNNCSNDCTFCVRNEKASYYGNYLWLDKEPTVEEVISTIDDIKKYDEIVFCGFGEPTYRIYEVITIADELKKLGAKHIRLNTNGHANLINGYNVVPQLKLKIDEINISMNASSKEFYNKLCRPINKEKAFESMLDFGRCCVAEKMNAHFSIVDCIGNEEIERCKNLAKEVGLPLRIREFIQDS